MKITRAEVFAVKIPFVSSFGHSLKSHKFSESVIVRLTSDTGTCGYGEGVPRSYVTGETRDESIRYVCNELIPSILGHEIKRIATGHKSHHALKTVNNCLAEDDHHNASRASVELAMLDLLFKDQQESLSAVLPPRKNTITYSGVISSGDVDRTIKLANIAKQMGLKYVKLKVGQPDDLQRVARLREVLGPMVSIRLDANGAFDIRSAVAFMKSVEQYDIACMEQPMKRGDVEGLASLRAEAPIPIMVDESLVSLKDAEELVEHRACDFFNLRISKFGGIYRTLVIAELAARAGLGLQLGCHVGETAILSAAGRHVSAYLKDIQFVEGSYSSLLLEEDISRDPIVFWRGGEAPVLTAPGLGVTIDDDLLKSYTGKVIRLP